MPVLVSVVDSQYIRALIHVTRNHEMKELRCTRAKFSEHLLTLTA